ncbi:MAG: hypothetical protein ACRC16_22000 [Aeromonas salmonicida]
MSDSESKYKKGFGLVDRAKQQEQRIRELEAALHHVRALSYNQGAYILTETELLREIFDVAVKTLEPPR